MAGHAPSGPPLDALDEPQQGGRSDDGFDAQDRVDIAGLSTGP
jgi:hypothetical protein